MAAPVGHPAETAHSRAQAGQRKHATDLAIGPSRGEQDLDEGVGPHRRGPVGPDEDRAQLEFRRIDGQGFQVGGLVREEVDGRVHAPLHVVGPVLAHPTVAVEEEQWTSQGLHDLSIPRGVC